VDIVSYIVTVIGAYLVGSIPTGYLVARAKGVDIRGVGSGNIGATNVFRILGPVAGVFVLLMDGLKGFAACAWLVDAVTSGFAVPGMRVEYYRVIAGVAVVLGHNYTCWLHFKGGKGIATSAGLLAALVPWALIISVSLWILVLVASRYVSLASIAAAAVLPVATWISRGSLTLVVVTAVLSSLAIYKHRANIHRLREGTEHRISFRKKEAAL
jgi:acyl phosphate:glycerol-3-phosphate acyltransferase